jgi:glycerol-3-phosphate acyltransferase PlsY
MNPSIALLAAAGGYLIGSVSFARLVVRAFAPGRELLGIEVEVPDRDVTYRSGAVSATTVNLQLGPRYGCLTSLLDILKVAVPALALKLWWPGTVYYLVFAAAGTIGHNWPLYYRFRGGRGMSTILGGMLVVDWMGILFTTSISFAVGALLRSFYLANRLGILLMIPWLWFRHRDWRLVAYAVVVNVVNWIAVLPEAREMLRLRREGALNDFLEAKRLRVRSPEEGQAEERLTFYGMLENLIARARKQDNGPGDTADSGT